VCLLDEQGHVPVARPPICCPRFKKHTKYDPALGKNDDTAKITQMIQNEGYDISVATVKRMLVEVFEFAKEKMSRK
jgi:hypothetical protein